MSNPGNTGQRYVMSKVLMAELRDGSIIMPLSCGHTYAYQATYEQALANAQRRIGSRTRCNRCVKEVSQ